LTSIYTPAQVVDTSYGRTLIAKLALVAPLLLVGWLHNRALTPQRFQNAERWIMRTLRAESALGVTVIMVAGLLSATPPPAPLTARGTLTLPTYSASAADLSVTLTLNPGGIGSNAYDVQLSRAGVPLDGARVWLTFAYPALGKRSAIIALDAVGGGQYSGGGGELTRAGDWQAWFDVLPADAPPNTLPTRLALTWTVSAQTGTGTDRQPSVLNIASLLAILVVIAAWLIPAGRRRARQMQLDPLAVMVGVGALALTVVVFIGGGWYISNANADYEAAANPPPPHVNPTLPDQGSIIAGSGVFAAQCASCHNAANAANTSAPVPDPQKYVNTRTDSDLYSVLRGTNAHPYGKTLSEADRWTLENYLRATANATQEIHPTS
jgi:mono/diheme cytochrome c family protein